MKLSDGSLPGGALDRRQRLPAGRPAPGNKLRAVWNDTCFVAPSPELRARWDAELERLRATSADLGAAVGVLRKPRHLGFDDGVIIPPEDFELGTPVDRIRSMAADRAPLRGTVRVIVVLVDFSDKQMAPTAGHFNDLFFSTGVLPHGSVKEFYSGVTNGLVTLSGDVVGVYRMPQTLAGTPTATTALVKGEAPSGRHS